MKKASSLVGSIPKRSSPGSVMNHTPESSMSRDIPLETGGTDGPGEVSHCGGSRQWMRSWSRSFPTVAGMTSRRSGHAAAGVRDKYLGHKIQRNDMHKQNSFSTFWTAEALLATYQATGNTRYLQWGTAHA